MEKEFDDILKGFLDLLEANPDADIDLLISKKFKEMGLSENAVKMMTETSEYIDDYSDKYNDMLKAKAEGKSKEEWLEDTINNAFPERTDDERKAIFETVDTTLEKTFEDSVTEEEKKED